MSLQKLLTSRIGAILIIIPFVKPASELTGDFDKIFDVWKIISVVLILMGYTAYKKRIKTWNELSLAIFGVQIIYVISTILNVGDIKTAFIDAASNIAICCYLEYLIKKKDLETAAKNFASPCVILAIITALTMFIYYPKGMYSVGWIRDNYLWGFDNTSAFRFIPTMYFLGVYSIVRNDKKIKFFCMLIFSFYTSAFIYVWSLTAGIMMLIFTIVYTIIVITEIEMRLINTRNAVIAVIILSTIVIIYKNDVSQIMNFASKNDKFGSISLRFSVWRKTIEQWMERPFIGYGVEHIEVIKNKIILDHPHNLFLDVLYHGGVAGLSFLIFILGKIVMMNQTETKINKITAVALLSLLIVGQMDFYNSQYLFYPTFFLGYYSIKKEEIGN